MTKYIEIDGIGEVVPRSEYDALTAQVEALRGIAYLADGARVENSEGNLGEERKWLDKLYQAAGEYDCTKTPQQHLAEIRAQAVIDFTENAINILSEDADIQVSSGADTDAVDIEITNVVRSSELRQFSNQYADSIRKGEVK